MLCYEGLISILLEIISNDFSLTVCVMCVFVLLRLPWIRLPLLIHRMALELKPLCF